MNIYIYI